MTTSDVLLRLAIALPFGLVFGSFMTVAIHRVPGGGVARASAFSVSELPRPDPRTSTTSRWSRG